MSNDIVDVVVVGGGPAGATAATEAADEAHKVEELAVGLRNSVSRFRC